MFLIFCSSGKGELLGGVSRSMSGADSASSSRFLRNRVGVKKYFFQKKSKKNHLFWGSFDLRLLLVSSWNKYSGKALYTIIDQF